jgi:hypothetical protein
MKNPQVLNRQMPLSINQQLITDNSQRSCVSNQAYANPDFFEYNKKACR